MQRKYLDFLLSYSNWLTLLALLLLRWHFWADILLNELHSKISRAKEFLFGIWFEILRCDRSMIWPYDGFTTIIERNDKLFFGAKRPKETYKHDVNIIYSIPSGKNTFTTINFLLEQMSGWSFCGLPPREISDNKVLTKIVLVSHWEDRVCSIKTLSLVAHTKSQSKWIWFWFKSIGFAHCV